MQVRYNVPVRQSKLRVIKVAIATGFHLFPFRTEKLSPSAPMVLRKWESRSPPSSIKPRFMYLSRGFLIWIHWINGMIRLNETVKNKVGNPEIGAADSEMQENRTNPDRNVL